MLRVFLITRENTQGCPVWSSSDSRNEGKTSNTPLGFGFLTVPISWACNSLSGCSLRWRRPCCPGGSRYSPTAVGRVQERWGVACTPQRARSRNHQAGDPEGRARDKGGHRRPHKGTETLGAAVILAEPRDPLWLTQTSGCALPLHHCGGLPRLGCSSQSQEEMGESRLGDAHLEQT